MLEPTILEGYGVRLEPLLLAHAPSLADVGRDPVLWRWIPMPVLTVAAMHDYVAQALQDKAAGSALPFAVRDLATETLVGSTRYGNIAPDHRRLEIGWTWLTPRYQRTGMNTAMKYLLLRHAFETLRYHRVELKTDALNVQSRTAIEGIGAQFEGIFRKHIVCADGRVRDTAYYSIIDTEWPSIRTRLETRLAGRPA